jgi:ribosomal protein S18 acetylase RimI-like enzyme
LNHIQSGNKSVAPLIIRPFQAGDQAAAKALILAGLQEHWGWLDETKNPDLDNIGANYGGGLFLVACLGEEIVGTGALIKEQEGVGRIVRMSVAKTQRRQGIGQRMLEELVVRAGPAGYRQIVLETTATWTEAIGFYESQGFRPVGVKDGEMHFVKEL